MSCNPAPPTERKRVYNYGKMNSLRYAIKQAGTRISNKISGAIKFFKLNAGAIVARIYIKNTFVSPWGWIRPYI